MANKYNDSYQYPILIADKRSLANTLQIYTARDVNDLSMLRKLEESEDIIVIKAPLTYSDKLVFSRTRDEKGQALKISQWTEETLLGLSVEGRLANSDKNRALTGFILDNGLTFEEWVIQNMEEGLMTDLDRMIPLQPYLCRKNNMTVGSLMRINETTTLHQIRMFAGDRKVHTSTLRSLDRILDSSESDAYLFNSVADYNITKVLHKTNVHMEVIK